MGFSVTFLLVILTRFSRVTFHAAHKYLGLTTEVLRTEKAINEIACHPLPNSFYEGGGLHRLRQRLDQRTGTESPESVDYFSPRTGHSKELSDAFSTSDEATVISDSPQTYAATKETISLHRLHPSRHMVQAGDLHSTTYISDTYRPYFRAGSSLNVSANFAEHGGSTRRPVRAATRLTSDEFDLREEVMSCIAKSIGLHQPPLSGNESTNASPAFPASEAGGASPKAGLPRTSFGSLSLLETGDDASSVTSSSAAGTSSTGQIGALDNEVEILFFAAGSRLVNTGERHAGLFYVIDGSWTYPFHLTIHFMTGGTMPMQPIPRGLLFPTELPTLRGQGKARCHPRLGIRLLCKEKELDNTSSRLNLVELQDTWVRSC